MGSHQQLFTTAATVVEHNGPTGRRAASAGAVDSPSPRSQHSPVPGTARLSHQVQYVGGLTVPRQPRQQQHRGAFGGAAVIGPIQDELPAVGRADGLTAGRGCGQGSAGRGTTRPVLTSPTPGPSLPALFHLRSLSPPVLSHLPPPFPPVPSPVPPSAPSPLPPPTPTRPAPPTPSCLTCGTRREVGFAAALCSQSAAAPRSTTRWDGTAPARPGSAAAGRNEAPDRRQAEAAAGNGAGIAPRGSRAARQPPPAATAAMAAGAARRSAPPPRPSLPGSPGPAPCVAPPTAGRAWLRRPSLCRAERRTPVNPCAAGRSEVSGRGEAGPATWPGAGREGDTAVFACPG